MPKTCEQIQEEVNKNGVEIQNCPICQSGNVHWAVLEPNECPIRSCECLDCKASWTEVYTWAGIDNLEKGA